ncbi:mitochondrial carrier protein, putative [Plasmodium gallinaceum]|uniref:Mitochondrial carrier protein, putative n=1 Tax=Plasmodium gallinaceum TaxID=5849 RepID=A0A1J1GNR8_PLAGA|nr:mitochondrial carrier protein, putative [Plasmodium gallinaceum]CRG94045.1 mitochondrial carrier protein, putative [Plasmodium gallinaceum]
MEAYNKNEEEKKEIKNKNKILICGLISGILTKTMFAPFDRIKLFYQIQPMFYHYNTKKKKFILKNTKESTNNNILLNGVDNKNFSKTSEIKKFISNKNIVFHNFKNSLKEIIRTNKKKEKKIYMTNKTSQIYKNYNNSINSHKTFKKILFNYKNNLYLNNLSKNYRFLNSYNVKNMLQNKFSYLTGRKVNNQTFKYKNIIQSFIYIIKEEGILGLWKGNLINTIRGGLVYSSKFGTNDIIKESYKRKKKKNNETLNEYDIKLENSNNYTKNTVEKKKKINYYESLTAGYASGVIQKTVSYPLDLLSIRMALGINEKYLRSNLQYKRKSIFKIIKEINTNEGFSGFFKGFFPTLLTGVPYVTLQMLFFDFYKNIFQNYFSHKSNSLSSIAFYSSISGSLSNLTSLIIVFPGDTVRKRMMNNGIDNKNYIYKNTFHCIKNIYCCEGFKNFYYGLFPSMLKAVPSGAIQFMTYEILKYMLTQN